MTRKQLFRFAAELDKQADARRDRAIYAASEVNRDMDTEETDRWRLAFSTSYQTLRGIAAAVRAVAEEAPTT